MDHSESQTIFSNLPVNKRTLTLKAKCIKNQVSNLACNNTNCQEYAFVCGNRNCECRTSHKKCLFTCSDQILQLIEQKRAESSDVIDKVSIVLDKWIDEISKTRQKIQDMLLDWGLSGAEKKFIQLIQKEDYKKLTGNHIHQITTQTIGYFSEETKQRLFLQIEKVEENYDAQIKSISKAVLTLFEKYQIQQKDVAFKDNNDIKLDLEYHFQADFHDFRTTQLKIQGKLRREDYEKTITFVKNALRKDFQAHMKRYKNNRRAYGSKKLREKYFEDYFEILSKGKQCIKKWQVDTQEQIKRLNKSCERQIGELCCYFHQSDGLVEKPFTAQTALSLQRTINVIEMLIDFTKKNGKQRLYFLKNLDKPVDENFVVSIYFLDEIMDDHPEIDEIEVMWNVIRFSEKLKDEINLLYDCFNEAKNDVYNYELN